MYFSLLYKRGAMERVFFYSYLFLSLKILQVQTPNIFNIIRDTEFMSKY
jgi:hypothetical protein